MISCGIKLIDTNIFNAECHWFFRTLILLGIRRAANTSRRGHGEPFYFQRILLFY